MLRLSPKTTYVTILGGQGIARGLLIALLSFWVVQARLNALELVLLGTALEGVLFCLQVPTGAFADAVGRKTATVIGYALLGLGLGLQGLTRDFGALLALQAISGAAWAFLIGSIEAWIAQQAGTDDLERTFLRGGQASMAGLMAGMGATVLLGQIDPRLPIFAGGALLILVSGIAALSMAEDRPVRVEIVATAVIGLRQIRASRVLGMLVLVALALGISSEGWDRLYSAHLIRNLGMASAGGLSPVGWLALIGLCKCALGIGAFQLVASRLSGLGSGVMLAVLYLSRGAMMLVFALAPALGVAVIAYLAAETFGNLGGPFLDAWIARETPQEVRATVLSVVGQADALGQIVAGPAVGLLGVLASIRAALAVSAVLMLPAGLLAQRARGAKVLIRAIGSKSTELI